MGTDLFTSARGPGLIGMLLALIVLGGFTLLAMFAFDESEPEGEPLSYTIEKGEKKVERLRKSIGNATEQLEKTRDFEKVIREISAVEARLQVAKNRTTDLEGAATEAKEAVKAEQQKVAAYKQQYRESARAAMVGREFETLKTQEGRVFKKVKVSDIDPARMQIRHASGITGVKLVELPDDLQEFLQIDSDETSQYLDKEKTIAKNYSQQVDHTDHKIGIAKLEERLRVIREEEGQATQQIAKNTAAIEGYRAQIEARRADLEADQLRSQTGGVSKAPQIRGHINNLEAQMRKTEQSIPLLQQKISAGAEEAARIEASIAKKKQEFAEKVSSDAQKSEE